MAYCTIADMQGRFDEYELIELSNPGGSVIDENVINQAILDAEAEIEAYLGGRYDLPLDPVPKILVPIACKLTRYYLYDNAPTEAVEKSYQDAIRTLKDVAKGTIRLGISTDGNTASQNESSAEISSDSPVWGRPTSGGFI